MRVLLVLIKREIIDDAPYFVVALGISIVFLVGLGSLGFVSPKNQRIGVVSLLLVLPVLAGMGFYFVGVLQGPTSRDGDVARHLSSYPISPVLFRAATAITGVSIVAVTVTALAIGLTGGIIAGIVEWPESLFPRGLIDLVVGVFLIALACYGLGLIVARSSESGWSWLIAWPGALALVSLIVIKGLGLPLIVPLIVFIAMSLCGFLISRRRWRATVLTRGAVALVLIAIPLYWLRCSCDVLASLTALEPSYDAEIDYYGFPSHRRAGWEVDRFTMRTQVNSYRYDRRYGRCPFLLQPLGIMRFLHAKWRGGDRVYSRVYFDAEKGLFTSYGRQRLYAGPRAVAEAPLASLGHFKSRPVCLESNYGGMRDHVTIFDPNTRCFYTIDFAKRQVRRGPVVSDQALQPLEGIDFASWRAIQSIRCGYPSLSLEDEPYGADRDGSFVPIVDRSGAIAVLDWQTATLIPAAGRLPRPHTFFGLGSPVPRNCLDYRVKVVVKQPEKTYAGLAVACLPRQGAPLTLAFFPGDGRLVQESWHADRTMSMKAPLVLKGLVESLHPPVLTLASFFLAERFDAGQAWRTLLFVPNSLVAQQRDRETGFLVQFAMALVFLLPAVFLAALLAWRIAIDAKRIGLSSGSRRFWLAVILVFGLPAYITYRVARPKVTLLICRNCGQPRRAEMERCHHCGKGWHMPEIDARGWQVTGAQSCASDRCLPA